MKKSVLLLAAMLVAGNAFAFTKATKASGTAFGFLEGPKVEKFYKAPAKAEAENEEEEVASELKYGYAADPYTAYRLGTETKGDYIYVAFKLTAEDCTKLAGNKIASISTYTGIDGTSYTNKLKKVFPFITTDLTKKDYEYSGSITCGNETFTEVTDTLATPYTIEAGKDLYIGYYFAYTSSLSNQYYLVVDGDATTAENTLYGVSTSLLDHPSSFTNYANEIGSACISVTLTGDNLPQNMVSLTDLELPAYSKPGEEFEYAITVWNRGANTIKTVTINSDVDGLSTPNELTLDAPLASNERVDLYPVAKGTQLGFATLTATVEKVNGNDNLSSANSASDELTIFNEGYARKIVVEEGTGHWCGYCPAGMVMMEYLKENYADNYALIAVHSQNNDPMISSSYQNLISDYVSGFPYMLFNRYYGVTPSALTVDQQHEYLNSLTEYLNSYPAYANIEFTGNVNQDSKKIELTSKTTFAFDTDVTHYVAFAVVEDNVGPYVQTNYYGNKAYGLGEMGGWENRSTAYSMMFNDVARQLSAYPGHKNSIPSKIEAGQEYEYSTSVSIKNVVNDDFRVVAMVVNGETGEIANAAEVPFQWTGVEDIIADEDLNAANAETVYTLDGRRVSKAGLESGLYIMVKNGKASKVLVK